MGEDQEIYETRDLHILIPFRRAQGKATLPEWAIWPILLRRERGEKGRTQDRLLIIDIDMEGKEEENTKVMYDYPGLVEQAKASERIIKGELFIGFPWQLNQDMEVGEYP